MRMTVALFGSLLSIAALAGVAGSALGLSTESAAAEPASQAQRELVFLTWPDFIDPDLVAEFEREQQIALRFEYFDSDDARNRLVAQTDGIGFDLFVLDNVAIESYQRRGWIVPIDADHAPNLRAIDPKLDLAYPGTTGLAVPYFWGTLGIAYRRDLVPRPLRSWMDLLRPDAALAGKILMIADSYDLIGMPLKALGHSMNSADPEAIAQAAALLAEQRPAVLRYGTLSLGADSELLSGRVAAAMAYNGDAATLMNQNDDIVYVVPQEGGAIWIDYLALGAYGRRPLALAFIDYLNRPEVAARNARYLHYATPNLAAEALLPADFLADALVYPDARTLARSEYYRPLAAAAVRRRVQAYSAIVYGN